MTLDEAKAYLRIDFSDDDNFIQSLIDISTIYIDTCCGTTYKTIDNLVKLAKLAQYKLIADMYEKRTGFVERESRDIIIDTIFSSLANAEVIEVVTP